MKLIAQKAKPASRTMCLFNSNKCDGEYIVKIAVRAVTMFAKALREVS